MSTNETHQSELILEPPRGWLNLHLRELWQFRELLYFLIWRDIKVRYKQTVLGILCAGTVHVPIKWQKHRHKSLK